MVKVGQRVKFRGNLGTVLHVNHPDGYEAVVEFDELFIVPEYISPYGENIFQNKVLSFGRKLKIGELENDTDVL